MADRSKYWRLWRQLIVMLYELVFLSWPLEWQRYNNILYRLVRIDIQHSNPYFDGQKRCIVSKSTLRPICNRFWNNLNWNRRMILYQSFSNILGGSYFTLLILLVLTKTLEFVINWSKNLYTNVMLFWLIFLLNYLIIAKNVAHQKILRTSGSTLENFRL